MEKEWIYINDHKIAYIDTQVGEEIVVILHGWGANMDTVVPIINALKDRYRVLAYDAYGHGESEEIKFVAGGWAYMELLHSFLDQKEISRAHFIGHSFGGKTLTVFAATYPQYVDKLVLVDASGVKPKRKLSYYFKVYSFKAMKFLYTHLFFWKDREEQLEKFYKSHGSADYQATTGNLRNTFVKVVNEETTEYFAKIKAPTLLIWGEEDEDTPLYMAKVFEEKIPEAGLVILQGGHYSYLDDYSTFTAVIRSFL